VNFKFWARIRPKTFLKFQPESGQARPDLQLCAEGTKPHLYNVESNAGSLVV